MIDWVLSQEGDKWSVNFDVRDLGGIWILPFVAGLQPWLPELGWLLPVWFLFLLSLWISMVGLGGLSGPCSSLLLSMILRPPFWPLLACVNCGPQSTRLCGLVVNLWLVSVQCLASGMGLLGVTLGVTVAGCARLFAASYSYHVRERDKALLRSVMVGGVWKGFLLGRVRWQPVPCRFCGAPDGDDHFLVSVPFLLLSRFVKILSFMIS